MIPKKQTDTLFGIKGICQYLNGCSKEMFYALVEMGMPVTKKNGRIFAHAENIEKFFRDMTDKPLDGLPDEDE